MKNITKNDLNAIIKNILLKILNLRINKYLIL